MRQTQIEQMLADHERRIKVLEKHAVEQPPIEEPPTEKPKKESPITKGLVRSAMVKEAEASIALDGETQTITPETDDAPKTPDQVESKTKGSAEKKNKGGRSYGGE